MIRCDLGQHDCALRLSLGQKWIQHQQYVCVAPVCVTVFNDERLDYHSSRLDFLIYSIVKPLVVVVLFLIRDYDYQEQSFKLRLNIRNDNGLVSGYINQSTNFL